MRFVAEVIKEGEDLREAIERVVKEYKITAGSIISCVGAVRNPKLRMAGATREKWDETKEFSGDYEIVGVTGCVGMERFHVHVSLSDKDGNVVGGHLKPGNLVHITAELVILAEDSLRFVEKEDPDVGWNNMFIEKT